MLNKLVIIVKYLTHSTEAPPHFMRVGLNLEFTHEIANMAGWGNFLEIFLVQRRGFDVEVRFIIGKHVEEIDVCTLG